MSRSHPPSLLKLAERCLTDECGLGAIGSGERRLVVAVSGGADSLALGDVLARLQAKLQLQLLVVSVDHGLRAAAAAEVQMVERFCALRGLPFRAETVRVGGEGGLQAAARAARYRALTTAADEHFGADALIATGHHADDRAETLLLALLRGVSLEGLNVLPPRSGRRIRPLLRARRQDILAHIGRQEIAVAEDPSNTDSRFLRVRVRSELLPLLADLSPGVVAALNTLADEAGALDSPTGLTREQRKQLRRALKEPSLAVDLPLPSGLRLIRQRSPH